MRDTLRVSRRDERRQQRAERMAAQSHDLSEPQLVEHTNHIRRMLGDRVALRRLVAQAPAAQVDGDDTMA